MRSVVAGPPVRSGPSPSWVREESAESRVSESRVSPVSPVSPEETVGGWLRILSMTWRSSAPLFRAPSVSVDSTWLLTPAPTKVDQLVDQSPSKAPLIRISATDSPAPAARKSAVPLIP
ncbi:hypothetical protein [Streptomyces sp. uw30]|uniref:hypothetical protein n=1 Tax=Streptomyces sp. uw30 TaxID=1828179 RepID=UPI0016515C38|nr:hypothetical protein [Streptomyces sp. uw30]